MYCQTSRCTAGEDGKGAGCIFGKEQRHQAATGILYTRQKSRFKIPAATNEEVVRLTRRETQAPHFPIIRNGGDDADHNGHAAAADDDDDYEQLDI